MIPLKEAIRSWELYRLPFNLVLFVFGLNWSWSLRETMKEEAWFGYWGSVLAFGGRRMCFIRWVRPWRLIGWLFVGVGLASGGWAFGWAGWQFPFS